MAPEQWENDLRLEAEGLDHLSKLFRGFLNLLDEAREKYQGALDENLLTLIECLEYDIQLTLDGTITVEELEVPGIIRQLDDVMDEIQTLQAGLPTKEGIADED